MRLPSATALPVNPSPTSSRTRIEEAARGLEAQFAHLLIKSMRSATPGDPLLGSNTTYREMYDQQLSKELTKGRGLGLAPMIVRQLERATSAQAPVAPVAPMPLAPAAASPMAMSMAPSSLNLALPSGGLTLAPSSRGVSMQASAPLAPPPLPAAPPVRTGDVACDPTAPLDCSSPEAFVRSIWPHAQKVAAELNVPAKALVAQAALETAWGRRLVGGSKGGISSHNLFGIKAGARWLGEKVSAATHEFVDGVRQNTRAAFRAYGSAGESFNDYARLLRGGRYAAALGTGNDTHRFASALQKAGYATDPSYASKISAIANGDTLNRALAGLPGAPKG